MTPRTFILILALLTAGVARAQSGSEWTARWMADQRSANRGVVRVSMLEKASLRVEYASGSRNMQYEEEITFGPAGDRFESRMVFMEVDGRRMPQETPEQRARREEGRSHGDPQREARRFNRPLSVIEGMQVADDTEAAELDGRSTVRVAMTSRETESPIPRLTAWFDTETGALVQVRAFVGGQGPSALTAFVRYARISGIDLPVRRYTEGSFSFRRREREFSSLVNARVEITAHRVERE